MNLKSRRSLTEHKGARFVSSLGQPTALLFKCFYFQIHNDHPSRCSESGEGWIKDDWIIRKVGRGEWKRSDKDEGEKLRVSPIIFLGYFSRAPRGVRKGHVYWRLIRERHRTLGCSWHSVLFQPPTDLKSPRRASSDLRARCPLTIYQKTRENLFYKVKHSLLLKLLHESKETGLPAAVGRV